MYRLTLLFALGLSLGTCQSLGLPSLEAKDPVIHPLTGTYSGYLDNLWFVNITISRNGRLTGSIGNWDVPGTVVGRVTETGEMTGTASFGAIKNMQFKIPVTAMMAKDDRGHLVGDWQFDRDTPIAFD